MKAAAPGSAGITYSLPTAPAGMSINASTGLITWTPTASQEGTSFVSVAATDQSGDTTQQAFSIDVGGWFGLPKLNPLGPVKRF